MCPLVHVLVVVRAGLERFRPISGEDLPCFDAWGADNTGVVKLRELCTQIFRMRVAIFGDRFFVCGSAISVTFFGQDGADF